MGQITAGLKKELMFAWRGFRFGGMLLLFLGGALVYPLTSWMMIAMGDMLESETQGLEIPGMEGMDALVGFFNMEMTYVSSLAMITSAVLLTLILIMGAGGKEQKQRSIIIPQTAGLTAAGYVLPKFMLYPPMVFVLSVASAFLANGATHLVFKESFSANDVLLTGTLYGLLGVFSVCLYLFLGISLAQPGLSILYVFIANEILGLMVTTAFSIDRYTPWNLAGLATSVVYSTGASASADERSMAVTAVITLGLCFAFLLLTLFAMKAKRMDNTADEVY